MREVIAAGELLERDWHVLSEVWSITSFSELAREARETQRWNRLHPTEPQRESYAEGCLKGAMPVIAATDYVCGYPQMIAAYLEAPFVALGTDGFGRSDTRAVLRSFFEVDRRHITVAALQELARSKAISAETVARAVDTYAIDATCEAPWGR